ncbi:glutathione synthase [Sugiyamaella lignohabitans]|uniref:Glutathione synthetase n=1 Tax=Sugiyamaella lignohabitans TaxID=796027 RepID=A0A161HN55_9ASCO|nr:glutathione synthase [Sugiyamaella lignohabitans]ANB15487.1 glutathione synthase [Sugiyamaella lignohabitans]
MAGGNEVQYPPRVSHQNEANIVRYIQDWSLANGLVLLSGELNGSGIPAPVTVFPSPFSKSAFNEALLVQKGYNDIYHEIVKDEQWLLKELSELGKYDPDFTGRLLDIHLRVQREGPSQSLTGGLFRSDYIIHSNSDKSGGQIKQVEFNTVSVSFGGLSSKLSELHNYLVAADVYNLSIQGLPALDKNSIPISKSLVKLSSSLAEMHKAYITREGRDQGTAILFVVQPGERNALDQRLLEFELFNSHGIKSYRLTLEHARTKLTKTTSGSSKLLKHVASDSEISVVYYRSGYGPSDYPTEREWSARYFLENSHAIKCPSVLTQLSGAKKIQQLLTDTPIFNRFAKFSKSTLEDSLVLEAKGTETIDTKDFLLKKILDTFVKIYPLDESERGLEARKLAFDSPEKFVLKPQREGGGNNVYRRNIPSFLTSIPKKNWGAYILMELIEPAENKNKILRMGEVYSGNVVSELGVFGGVLWDTKTGESYLNSNSDWLLRTKLETSDEGGVAAGFGCIDSVYLV